MSSNQCQDKEIIAEGEIICSTHFAINLQHSRKMGLVMSQMKWLSVILCKPNGSQKQSFDNSKYI